MKEIFTDQIINFRPLHQDPLFITSIRALFKTGKENILSICMSSYFSSFDDANT